jgi:predicted ArsR family transcriptional regulator
MQTKRNQVLAALTTQPSTAAQIGARTGGLHEKAVRRWLRRFVIEKLAMADWATTAADPQHEVGRGNPPTTHQVFWKKE